MPAPVKIGDPVTFCPSAFADAPIVVGPGGRNISRQVRGRVICVNPAHRTYTVEAEINGYRLRETFKF